MSAVITVQSGATRDSITRVVPPGQSFVQRKTTGCVIAGRFRVRGHVRSGGMGDVYLSDDLERGGSVALKLLSTTASLIVDRFLREAAILAELEHPAIVGHIAHGVDAGVPYLAMEWIDGEPLSDRLRRGTLTVAETLELGERLASALALVHARGIVHRDIKPSNIVLAGRAVERAVLLDFGIAHVDFAEEGGELTRTGELLGTPGYMAPEQALGARIDARADVFALGCVLYRCLTRTTPFPKGEALQNAIRLLLDDAPRLTSVAAGIPAALDELVARMLARAKGERPEDGAAIACAIAAIRNPDATRAIVPRRKALGRLERRAVSIVLARRPDADVTLAGIEAMREILTEPIAEQGGNVEVLADGSVLVMTSGGAPREVALRAARAALLVLEELPDAHIIICTGRAVLEESAPASDLVDRAVALLDELRTSGAIKVDETTADLLASRFELEDRMLVAERKLEHPRTLLGKPTPFVGRAREITMLDATLAECETEGVARAIVVTAEAGMGKSRLMNEYVARTKRRRSDVAIWTAACDPIAKGAPLGVVAQLLRDALGVVHQGSIPERRAHLRAAIDALGIPRERRVAEFVGEILGVAFDDDDAVELRVARRDPQLFSGRLREAIREIVLAQCARGPLLVVLEDLHWGDAASVKLLEGLVAQGSATPLFVLAFGRPEIATAFPMAFGASAQTIRLLELSHRASMELVERVLGTSFAPRLRELVVTRAHGNAFFLEELIRAVAEGRDALPETVVATMEARTMRLAPDARKILRAASIFGEAVSTRAVHALVGGDLLRVEESLAHLAKHEFLVADGDRCRFRHAIVREAAYAMLTDEDRALGHRLAAEHLEQEGTADPIVVAEHYDASGDRELARFHLHRAAQQALGRSDLETTIALSKRVLALGATGALHASARMLHAEASIWQGDSGAIAFTVETLGMVPERSAAWYRACAGVLFASGQISDREHIAVVLGHLCEPGPPEPDVETASMQIMALVLAVWVLALLGMYDLARQLMARAEEIAPYADEQARGWIGIGEFFRQRYMARDPWGAYRGISTARATFERIGDPRLIVLAEVLQTSALIELGAFDEAEVVARRALATATAHQIDAAKGDAKRWLAFIMESTGRVREAVRLTEEAELEIRNVAVYRGTARAARAWALARIGHLDAASGLVRRALTELEYAPSGRFLALAWLAKIENLRGEHELALESAEEAEQLLEAFGTFAQGEAALHVAHATALRALGRHEEAAATIARGATLLRERANGIEDPERRRVYLEAHPDHMWLLREAGA